MDQEKSAALDNIEWLLYFDKKIFLNRNGVLYNAFCSFGIKCEDAKNIEMMSFEEFVEPLVNDKEKTKIVAHHSKKENQKMWNIFLRQLEMEQSDL